jgi:amino acid transporter
MNIFEIITWLAGIALLVFCALYVLLNAGVIILAVIEGIKDSKSWPDHWRIMFFLGLMVVALLLGWTLHSWTYSPVEFYE